MIDYDMIVICQSKLSFLISYFLHSNCIVLSWAMSLRFLEKAITLMMSWVDMTVSRTWCTKPGSRVIYPVRRSMNVCASFGPGKMNLCEWLYSYLINRQRCIRIGIWNNNNEYKKCWQYAIGVTVNNNTTRWFHSDNASLKSTLSQATNV